MDANHLLYAMAVTQLLLNYNSQELIFLHPAHVSFSDFFARKPGSLTKITGGRTMINNFYQAGI